MALPILPGLRLGAEAALRLFAANDGLSLDGDSTSGWLTGLGTRGRAASWRACRCWFI